MNRWLVAAGALLIAVGLSWRWLSRWPLFHLPGDIIIERPGFKLFLPLTSMLILSLVLSLIAWLLRR
jgi:hypothetical protein